jgi:hypothetical protein
MYILHYLVGTRNYALVYDSKADESLYAYCDSSYGMIKQRKIKNVDLCRDIISP